MRFVFKQGNSQVAYCALSIRSGTSNETPSHSGIAHLTEHMLFKGTTKKNTTKINNRLEVLGGELNAYTTKEETVIHAIVLKEDISKAIDLLFEIVFLSTFPQKELDKEKSVVMDEINLYKDSPSDYIFDDFEQFLFKDSPLARPILGTVSSLKKIKSEHIKEYVSNNFYPEQMSLSIVGNFEEKKIYKLSKKLLEKYTNSPLLTTSEIRRETSHVTTLSFEPFQKIEVKNHHQANCIIGCNGYSLYDDRRITLILLTNILGGPSSNSRLNSILREKKGLVYTVEASYTQYRETGAITIYFGCDKDNVNECKELIFKELHKIRTIPLSDSALKSAKKQMLAQLAIASENGEAQALALGKSILVFGHQLSDEEIRNKIEQISSDDILSVANDIFATDKLSLLFYI